MKFRTQLRGDIEALKSELGDLFIPGCILFRNSS